jgi:hypothetical protein
MTGGIIMRPPLGKDGDQVREYCWGDVMLEALADRE